MEPQNVSSLQAMTETGHQKTLAGEHQLRAPQLQSSLKSLLLKLLQVHNPHAIHSTELQHG